MPWKRKFPQVASGIRLPVLAAGLLLGNGLLHFQQTVPGLPWTNPQSLYWLAMLSLLALLSRWRYPLLAILLGYAWTLVWALHYLDNQLPANHSHIDVTVEGEVTGLPDASDRSVRFNFHVHRVLHDPAIDSMPERLRLSWYYPPVAPKSGDRWQLRVRLKPPHGMMNAGGFDYEKWLYTQGVHATGYVRKDAANRRLQRNVSPLQWVRSRVHHQLQALDSEHKGILSALAIGERTDISSRQWQVLIDTGTSHLMAISGLHIGLVAALVYGLMLRIRPTGMNGVMTGQQLAAVCACLVALMYSLIAGFAVPTQRALVMLCVMMGATLFHRPIMGLNSLALALIAVLLFDPTASLQPGFWLSFAAVFLIRLLMISESGASDRRAERLIIAGRMQLMIALSMLPLTLVIFGQASLISPLANLLAIPLVGLLLVPLVLFASLLSLISPEAGLLSFSLASSLLELTWVILESLSQLAIGGFSMASHYLPAPSFLVAAVALAGTLWLLMPRGFPARILAPLLFLPLLFNPAQRPLNGDVWLDIIDVGQGLAVLVRTRNFSLLYDAGDRFSERFDIGQRVVLPFLRHHGVKRLDTLLISHNDRDHRGGAAAILASMPVIRFMASRSVADDVYDQGQPARPVIPCEAGQAWEWDNVQFEILSPQGIESTENNRSCVLYVRTGAGSVILPGDIEASVERRILSREGDSLQADVLLLAHHGSQTSSHQSWLKSLQPQLAIASAGFNNRFGHPAERVRLRLREMGIPLLTTAQTGGIHIRLSAQGEKPVKSLILQRKVSRHYWNHRL